MRVKMVTRIGITGGGGFIGSLLAAQLCDKFDVVIIDNFSTGREDYLKDIKCEIKRVDLQNLEETCEALKGVDVLFHLAASGNVIESINAPIDNFNNNVSSTLNVLEAIRANEIKQVIFSSTGGALMGNTPPPVDENSTPAPISPYGASKLSCEVYIKTFAECYDVKYTIFRFGNVIGANSLHKKGVLNTFVKNIKAGQDLNIYGEVTRDFIYVGDLTRTLEKAIDNPHALNEIFHLSSEEEISISRIAEISIDELAPNSGIKINMSARRQGEVLRNFANNDKVKKHLEHKVSKPLETRVRETLKWLQSVY